MSVEFRLRRGTSSVASENNPVLADGEPGWERDTETLKIGDGVTPWNELLPFGAGDLGQLKDVAIASPEEGQTLIFNAETDKWESKTLLLSIERLTDVDVATVAPEHGQTLLYDAVTGQWKPGTGELEVGAWENDQVVTFSHGTPLVQENLSIPASGNTYPGNAQATVTVTEDMLGSANRDDVGFEQLLEVVFLFEGSGLTGTTNSTLSGEARYLGETATKSVSVNLTSSARQSIAFYLRGAAVGDVVEFRFRLNGATQSGVTGVAYSAVCYPVGLFQAVPEQANSAYMYQSFFTGPSLPAASFSTAYPTSPTLLTARYFDNNVNVVTSTNNAPEAHWLRWVGMPPLGIYHSYSAMDPTSRLLGDTRTSAAGAPWTPPHVRVPATVQFDRIVIPGAPI